MIKTCLQALLALPLIAGGVGQARGQDRGDGYPKLMGMNIGAKNYHEPAYQDALSRLDFVVLGVYPGWRGDRNGENFREVSQT